MATVVNTPSTTADTGAGAANILVVLVGAILLILMFFFFMNRFAGSQNQPNSTPSINVTVAPQNPSK